MANECRCSECGFLGLRNKATMQIEEAHHKYRKDGSTQNDDDQRSLHLNLPLCVRGVRDFSEDFEVGSKPEVVKKSILKPYTCGLFREWVVGFSPKEHVEMLHHEAILNYQKQRDEDDRKWRSRESRRERKWRKEDRKTAMVNLFIAAGVGIATALATLTAAGKIAWWDQLEKQPVQQVDSSGI